jgi:predicted RNase H-like HicB family nuclease
MTTQTKTKIRKLNFKVPIVIKKDTVGYHIFSPPLKGLHVDGDTPEEALKIGIAAAKLHLQTMIQYGDPIPLSLINDEEVSRSHLLEDYVSYHIENIQIEY